MAHGSFGDLLRTHRLRLGLTQEGVAERAGLSAQAIQKLERGATHPYRDTTNRLIRALDLSSDDEAEFRRLGQPAARHPRAATSSSNADGRIVLADLPVALTSFVGRERDTVEISGLLRTARLVTLTGVGGCGKTRLALEVARQESARFADGVALVELASVADAAQVPQTIASTFGVREVPTQPLLITLGGVLKPLQLLLLLDNCEHLLDASAKVADALPRSCANLTILATSREALGLPGEVSWRVPSLTLPPLIPLPSAERTAEFASVQLFVERAHAAHAPFAMTDRNAAAVAQVCHRLDGIPLALELSAVLVRGMSVEELAARLDQRFRLLTGGSRAALPRQQTLRATIDWSYQLLTPAERLLFTRLSVFASSWNVEAAEAVCGGRGIEPDDVLELVLRLVNKSLVALDEEAAQGQRYELLQTLRQYGREQLLAADESDALHDAHAAYFLDLAEKTESARSQLEAGGWTDPLEQEQADLEAALEWFIGKSDAERALRLASVLWHLWEVHGALTEGRRRLVTSLGLPGAEAPTLARARVLNGAGVLALNQYDIASARGLFRESLALYRRHNYDRGLAWVLIHLGWLALDSGHAKAAQRFLDRAHALSEQLNDRLGIARCLQLRGYHAWRAGDLEASRRLHLQSLALNRELGDKWGTAWALHRLSVTLWALLERGQGDAAPILRHIEEALAAWRELGERRHFAFSTCDLGIVAALQGRFDEARRCLSESSSIFEELDDRHGVVWVLAAYGLLFARQARPKDALRLVAALRRTRKAEGAPQPFRRRLEDIWRQVEAADGPDVARAVWTEGQAMTLSEAIAYVQSVLALTAPPQPQPVVGTCSK